MGTQRFTIDLDLGADDKHTAVVLVNKDLFTGAVTDVDLVSLKDSEGHEVHDPDLEIEAIDQAFEVFAEEEEWDDYNEYGVDDERDA